MEKEPGFPSSRMLQRRMSSLERTAREFKSNSDLMMRGANLEAPEVVERALAKSATFTYRRSDPGPGRIGAMGRSASLNSRSFVRGPSLTSPRTRVLSKGLSSLTSSSVREEADEGMEEEEGEESSSGHDATGCNAVEAGPSGTAAPGAEEAEQQEEEEEEQEEGCEDEEMGEAPMRPGTPARARAGKAAGLSRLNRVSLSGSEYPAAAAAAKPPAATSLESAAAAALAAIELEQAAPDGSQPLVSPSRSAQVDEARPNPWAPLAGPCIGSTHLLSPGAGGVGSLCTFDSLRIRSGPASC